MKTYRLVSLLTCILLHASFGIAFGADDNTSANLYFGNIEAPCANHEQCKKFTNLVIRASRGDECNKIDEACKVGEEILKNIFGNTYRQTLPDFVVYLDDSVETDKDNNKIFHLKKHPPLLLWEGENTPHLMGARAIYVVALAHRKLDLQARLTSDNEYEPNPLIGVLGVLKAPEIKSHDSKPTESKDGEFTWRRLDGNEYDEGNLKIDGEDMVAWLGVARIEVPENSINRVTVFYALPPIAKDASEAGKKAGDKPQPISVEKTEKEKDKYSGDFLAATGHFSNSPDSRAAVSFALGTTLNSKNTSIASGGSNINIDGFMFAKFYLSPPYLYASPRRTRYKPSLGLVVGTNINGTIFNNFVVGVSVGHIVGNVGFIAGVNSIAGISDSSQGRKNRAFLGMEYTF